MTKNYEIDIKHGITRLRFSGTARKDDVIEAIDDLVENYPCELRLWDISKGGMNISAAELREISNYGKSRFTKPSKLAIVARKETDFTGSLLFEIYRRDEYTEQKVFRNERDATVWLMNTSKTSDV